MNESYEDYRDKEDVPVKPKMRMTPQRAALIEDLQAGAKFMVTISNAPNINDYITIEGGGGRHSDSVVEGLFRVLQSENKLVAVGEGLFPGCGQLFELVR